MPLNHDSIERVVLDATTGQIVSQRVEVGWLKRQPVIEFVLGSIDCANFQVQVAESDSRGGEARLFGQRPTIRQTRGEQSLTHRTQLIDIQDGRDVVGKTDY